MKSKIVALAASAILLWTLPAGAQPPAASAAPLIEQRVEQMQARLNLTDEQASEISAILKAAAEGGNPCRSVPTQADRRTCMQQTVGPQIMAVLSNEQAAAFQAFLSDPQAYARSLASDRN